MIESLRRLRYRWSFFQFFAELMEKRWMEPMIPVLLLLGVAVTGAIFVDGFAETSNIQTGLTSFGEIGLVALGLAIVIMAGGIDLSVGSIFGLANISLLVLIQVVSLPVPVAIFAVLLIGAVAGAINGVAVAVLKAPPFLATLVTLIIYRAITILLAAAFLDAIVRSRRPESLTWLWMRDGKIAGLPMIVLILVVLVVIGHVVMTRMSIGWQIIAIGSSRKSARHAGMRVGRIQFATYVVSGVLASLAGAFYAVRLASPQAQTGSGLEITVLTAVVIGGISLAGGRGSTSRVLIGTATVVLITLALLLLNVAGQMSSAAISIALLVAVGIDAKWAKNRDKAIHKAYLNPTYVNLGELAPAGRGAEGKYALNDVLLNADAVGLGIVEGPEDVILDDQGRLYCGDRRGWIHRFSGDNYGEHEVFARIGGHPLGQSWDADGNLIVCSAGMGVYGVSPDGDVFKVTDETRRTPFRLRNDSSIGIADDLDVAPDGRIFFSDPTLRFDLTESWNDIYEGRPNGRVLCYDPKTKKTSTVRGKLVFPNGICVTHEADAILIASSWMCEIYKYWISGPREGDFEVFATGFPGYLDNINRASDGGYWLAVNGMRSPTFDLAMKMPAFRKRMIKTLPFDEWLFPSMNHGCVVKLSSTGEVEEVYWDPKADNYATITSMREFKGQLFVGGLENNKVGRLTIPQGHLGPACACGQRPCATRKSASETGSIPHSAVESNTMIALHNTAGES